MRARLIISLSRKNAPQDAANDHGEKGDNGAKEKFLLSVRTPLDYKYGALERELRKVLEPPGALGPFLNAIAPKSAKLDVAVRKSVRFRVFPGERSDEFCRRARQ